MCLAFVSCTNNLVPKQEKPSYSIEKQKSIAGGSYLDLNFFHADKKEQLIPAVFSVNGVLFGPKDGPLSYIIPINQGQFIIKATFIGKVENQVVVNAAKNDSLVVKIYLEDNPQPLID